MKTPAELAFQHTELGVSGFAHVQRLLASWGVLADLSFSDLLLLTPVTNADPERLVVLGQVRPATSATVVRTDLVGQMVMVDEWPLAWEAFRSGVTTSGMAAMPGLRPALQTPRDASETGEFPAVPAQARLECLPVRFRDAVVAVVVRVGALEERRRPGRLERAYQDLFYRLARMVAAGTYPFAIEEMASEDSPRVGDGLIVVDTSGRIRFASPNAMSALHRMGVSTLVEQHTLAEVGVEEGAVARALATGCPVIEEAERRPDVVVLIQCTPLIDDRGVTGGMVLLRDVTDLRRLDRLLLSKDAAIREVHHRVKNNLQTISALLRLQARRLDQGEAQQALREAERRVRSIAVVHEILSRDPGDEAPFGDIVDALVRMAEDTAIDGGGVTIHVTGEIGDVPADAATPLAVVIAELLQNAVEHAYVANGEALTRPSPDRRVDVALATDGQRLSVRVEDNGCGLPPGFDIDKAPGLGLSIVRDLVNTQLGGTIRMTSPAGTLVEIDAPIPGADGHVSAP